MQNFYNIYPSFFCFVLFVVLLTVTDRDLELVGGSFVLVALVAFHPFVMLIPDYIHSYPTEGICSKTPPTPSSSS